MVHFLVISIVAKYNNLRIAWEVENEPVFVPKVVGEIAGISIGKAYPGKSRED